MARRCVEAGDETYPRLPSDPPRSPEHVGCQEAPIEITEEIALRSRRGGGAAMARGWRPPGAAASCPGSAGVVDVERAAASCPGSAGVVDVERHEQDHRL